MTSEPVDDQTWRTFDWAVVKRFSWDACREVAVNDTYTDPWGFQDFLLASKRYAYKSDDNTTVDSFFNNNNIYVPFIEEVINDVVFWGFFRQTNNATEIEQAVYMPTQKIKDYAPIFKDLLDGEIDKIEEYRTRKTN